MPLENLVIMEQGKYRVVEELSADKSTQYMVLFNIKPVYDAAKQVRELVVPEPDNGDRILKEVDEATKQNVVLKAFDEEWLESGIAKSGNYCIIQELAKPGEQKKYFVMVDEKYSIGYVRLYSKVAENSNDYSLQRIPDQPLKNELIIVAGGVPGAKRPDKISSGCKPHKRNR